MQKISYYYQEFATATAPDDNISELIRLHVDSFARQGWEAVLVNEDDAREHELYGLFDDATSVLSKSRNPWEYTRACYMRWLAYAVKGHPFSDFDVINYGFTPQDAADIKAHDQTLKPIMLSTDGAMGLLDTDDYAQLLKVYVDFIADPKVEGALLTDINDMTIMRTHCLDWYLSIPYTDGRFVKNYSHEGWQTTKLVHYPYSTTKRPRIATILAQRPLDL